MQGLPVKLSHIGPDGRYAARPLQPPDLADLQELFERATDYFEVATGAPPAKDEATRAYVAGPPTKSVDDKRVIGLFDEQELIGVIDLLVDFPERGVWTMGMLLLDPAHRGAGLGRAALGAVEGWARGQGARGFRTAVVGHHQPGITFLERSGYDARDVLDDYDAGARRASVRFFSKALA